jgi:hypothetical protein
MLLIAKIDGKVNSFWAGKTDGPVEYPEAIQGAPLP